MPGSKPTTTTPSGPPAPGPSRGRPGRGRTGWGQAKQGHFLFPRMSLSRPMRLNTNFGWFRRTSPIRLRYCPGVTRRESRWSVLLNIPNTVSNPRSRTARMESAFDRMVQLVPPPFSPVGRGSSSKWNSFEESIGISLPLDYKWLVNTYGAGDFGDMLVPLNPFIDSDTIHYETQLAVIRDLYLNFKGAFSQECSYPFFPQANGLLPIAFDTNGNNFFWIANESPDDWGLIHYNWRAGCLTQKYNLTFVQFLIDWVDGHLPNSFFGRGNSSKIIRREPFFVPLHY